MIHIRRVKGVGLRDRIRKLASKVRDAVVQDCPPELSACEVCGQLNCRSAEWLSCEKRLAACEFMRTGDPQALAKLKELDGRLKRRDNGAKCSQQQPSGDPT